MNLINGKVLLVKMRIKKILLVIVILIGLAIIGIKVLPNIFFPLDKDGMVYKEK